jgi:nicotinamidase-related amidase
MNESITQQLAADAALVVVDAQAGFDDPWWGPRNNPDCDRNIAALVDAFAAAGSPVVYVRHESDASDSPLHPDRPGNALKPYLDRHEPDLVVTKQVNSSFHGEPDLDAWLRGRGLGAIVVCGITTNHCCETTARVGGNLGYEVRFVLDATHTFDRPDPAGNIVPAEQLAYITATNLNEEFAAVLDAASALADG